MNQLNTNAIRGELARNGWAFMASAIGSEVSQFVAELGPVIPPMRGEEEYRDLIPYDAAHAPPESMSSITGPGEQPMHTDCAYLPSPPRFVALHCLHAGEFSCPTRLWIIDHGLMLRDRPRLLNEPHWVFQGGGQSSFYSPIIEVCWGEMRTRFDPFCMRPASAHQITIEEAQAALKCYVQHLAFEWRQESLLVFDNWRCLHARGTGADKSPSRRLRRWCIGGSNGMGN